MRTVRAKTCITIIIRVMLIPATDLVIDCCFSIQVEAGIFYKGNKYKLQVITDKRTGLYGSSILYYCLATTGSF